jgi:UDP-glucose 4-epimerase
MAQKPRVIVTGGCGFIGTALTVRLVHQGKDVRVIDTQDPIARVKGAIYIKMDAADLSAACAEGAETIYHLAAIPGVLASDHQAAIHANLGTTVAVAEVAESVGAHLVFASSCATGSIGLHFPRDYRYTSGYAITKGAAESYLQMLICRSKLSASILRFANVYGPAVRIKSAVATMVCRALENQPLVVHGDGLQVRNFVSVYDVVDAVLLAAKYRYIGAPLAICSDESVTIRGLAGIVRETVSAALGSIDRKPSTSEIVFDQATFAGIDDAGVKPDRATEELGGWRPHADFRERLACLVRYWIARRAGEAALQVVHRYADQEWPHRQN